MASSLNPSQADRMLQSALARMSARDAKVLRLYYGINERHHTPEEIGNMMGWDEGQARDRIRDATLRFLTGPSGVEVERALDVVGVAARPEDRLDLPGSAPPITLLIDPGNASADDLAALYSAISDLYRAYGGRGIAFRSEGTEVTFLAGAL